MASCKPITKKVINSPESCVDDNLRGVVALYPKLLLHPKHRVVTLRRQDDSGKVAVLGGGGSGHEPFAAGLIGPGMLSGAVAGGVFASPPTGAVLYAIAQLYKHNSGGVLVLLGNYTGDRLNFGKAFEKAKNAGIKVEGFIVGEDVASSQNKTGGRSMCGEVFLYKLCGAMAEEGHDLLSIRDMATEVNKNMATLGVCLSACSLPGQPPLFDIAPDEMELGAGVHGEAGIEKLKMGSAKETVVLILDKIIAHLKLHPNNRVAAMINNLGGTSLLEMNIIAGEVSDYLVRKQIKMERIYSGHFKTSLEMHGFQICLLNLSGERGDAWLQLLDAPTGAGAWTGGDLSIGGPGGPAEEDDLPQACETKTVSGPALSVKEEKIFRESLRAASMALVENEELLNRLDSGCGDGDCGITLKKFSNAVLKYLESASLEYPSKVLWELSDMAETDMGGTSGGIYSLGLSAASQALAKATNNDRNAWLSAMSSAATTISKYGGAEPGDRTMLDTLHTAMLAYKENLGADLETLLLKIDEGAQKGAEATADMIPRAGRASYVSRAHSRGDDAGARALALALTHALADAHWRHAR